MMFVSVPPTVKVPWYGFGPCVLVSGLIAGLTSLAAQAQGQGDIADVAFAGTIIAAEDVSAIAKVRGFLVVGADEAIGSGKNRNFIQVLEPAGENRYTQHQDILLFEGDGEDQEMDIEGIAAVGDAVYVIGSHSKKRPKTKAKKSYDKNRKTFHGKKVKPEPSRGRLYRLTLTPDGSAVADSMVWQSLATAIEKDPVLGPFSAIPSKENGVDIEGLAADGEWLYAGFRGPVLRGGHVPVMRFKFETPADSYELRYVNLDGRGIRALARTSDGFLILAGPVGDGPGSFQLYHWDGKDVISGKGHDPAKVGRIRLLRDLSVPAGAKAEGLALLDEDDDGYDLIIVFDGIDDPLAQRHRIEKP